MDKSKVYIAASYTAHALAEEVAGILEPYCEVVSTWHKNVVDEEKLTPSEKYRAALNDLEQIDSCSDLLYLSTPHHSNGGRYFETGYAFALGKRVLIVGERNGVFDHVLLSVYRIVPIDTVADIADAIQKHIAALEAKQ